MNNSKTQQDIINQITCILVAIVRQWKAIILAVFICGMALDIYSTITYKPQYAASEQAILSSDLNTYAQIENAQDYIKTLNYIFNGQVVKDYIIEKTELDDISMTCSVTSPNNTNIINISILADSKKEAMYALKHIVEWYNSQSKQYQFIYKIDILEKMPFSITPANYNDHMANFKKGAVVAGGLMIFMIGLVAYFNDTIKTSKDLKAKISCRLFAKLPHEIKPRGKKFWIKNKKALLITSLKTSFSYKEAINKLRSNLEESSKKNGYKVIMVTSSVENEGKSSVAANLAIALAKNKHNVLLIDGDIKKPSVHKIFEYEGDLSINRIVQDGKKYRSQIIYDEMNELYYLCAKQDLKASEDIVSDDEFAKLMDYVRDVFDYVVIDASPSYNLNEPLIINEYVDATLLVVRQDTASARVINETISRLQNAKNNVIGCVYNAKNIDFLHRKKAYGHRYGYARYGAGERRK